MCFQNSRFANKSKYFDYLLFVTTPFRKVVDDNIMEMGWVAFKLKLNDGALCLQYKYCRAIWRANVVDKSNHYLWTSSFVQQTGWRTHWRSTLFLIYSNENLIEFHFFPFFNCSLAFDELPDDQDDGDGRHCVHNMLATIQRSIGTYTQWTSFIVQIHIISTSGSKE